MSLPSQGNSEDSLDGTRVPKGDSGHAYESKDDKQCQHAETSTPIPSDINYSPKKSERDTWDKLEIVSEVASAIIIPLIIAGFGYAIDKRLKAESDTLENKRISLQPTNAREKSDSDLKSNMFSKLLEKNESSDKKQDPKQKLFFLELLVYNFSETLTLTPIINDLVADFKSDPEKYDGLSARLSTALREAGSRQLVALSNSGGLSRFQLSEGKVWRLTALHCKQSDNEDARAIRRNLEVKIVNIEPGDIGDSPDVLNYRALVTVTVFSRVGRKVSRLPRSFIVDQSDLPLIDNIPLGDGLRFSLLLDQSKGGMPFNMTNRFPLAALIFTDQNTVTKDKPSELDYIKFLNDSKVFNPDVGKPIKNYVCENLPEGRFTTFVQPSMVDYEEIKI
jgi:hypothetical protein